MKVSKNNKKKSPRKTNKKNTSRVVHKKKKRGFTLLEFIGIILVGAILIAVAIPFAIGYFSDSSKESYIEIAKKIMNSARKSVNLNEYDLFDTGITYYIDVNCIKTGSLPNSPYGKFKEAYVIVTFDGQGHNFYWTSVSETGNGVKKIVSYDKLSSSDVDSNLKTGDLLTKCGIDNRKKYVLIDQSSNCLKKEIKDVEHKVSSKTGELIK